MDRLRSMRMPDYRTVKYINVDVWWVRLLNLVLQCMAVAYFLLNVIVYNTWAYSEVPMSDFNVWATTGLTTAANPHEYLYCSNASYSYAYSNGYVYDEPVCRSMAISELAQKTHSGRGLFLTTCFIETRSFFWPCDHEQPASCHGAPVVTEVVTNSTGSAEQCSCSRSHAYFPVGVENVKIFFEHSFDTTDRLTHRGSSNEHYGTVFEWPNGTTQEWPAGSVPNAMLAEWLAAAGTSLDSVNTEVHTPDYRDGTTEPFVRTTGLNLRFTVKYSNERNGRAVARNFKISSELEVEANKRSWAGMGQRVVYDDDIDRIQKADWDAAPLTRTRVSRESQGVLVTFRADGRIYSFDFGLLVNVIVSFLVLWGAIPHITEFIIFQVFPKTRTAVLAEKQTETVRLNEKERDAERAMNLATLALMYRQIDMNGNNIVEAKDLVRAFARVDGVSGSAAISLSEMIFNNARNRAMELAGATKSKRPAPSLGRFGFRKRSPTRFRGNTNGATNPSKGEGGTIPQSNCLRSTGRSARSLAAIYSGADAGQTDQLARAAAERAEKGQLAFVDFVATALNHDPHSFSDFMMRVNADQEQKRKSHADWLAEYENEKLCRFSAGLRVTDLKHGRGTVARLTRDSENRPVVEIEFDYGVVLNYDCSLLHLLEVTEEEPQPPVPDETLPRVRRVRSSRSARAQRESVPEQKASIVSS